MIEFKQRISSYCIPTSLKDGRNWAWCPASDAEFVQYAAQEKLDWVNEELDLVNNL